MSDKGIQNQWPNGETGMVANWLGAKRYKYLIKITATAWNKYRGFPDRSALARTEAASQIERDVRAGLEAVNPQTAELLRDVAWHRIADNSLARFAEYDGVSD